MRRLVSILVLVSVTISGCRRTAERTPAKTETQAPEPSPAPALIPLELEAQLHVPPLARGARGPLLVLLHGLGSSGREIEQSDWARFAAERGIAFMAPSGPRDARGRRFWNAGKSCCDFDGQAPDHVAELRRLIEHALAAAPLDRARVFVGGHSNGGFMAHRLACEAPDLVRGIVSVAGAGALEPLDCRPPANLRVLEIHGDADPIVSYAGGHLFGDARLPQTASALQTVNAWAQRLGCHRAPDDPAELDLEANLPAKETLTTPFGGCERGAVELWTVRGGGHNLGFSAPAPALIWSFLNG